MELNRIESTSLHSNSSGMIAGAIADVLNMSEEECRKREQERNAQETEERKDEEKEERIKTELTEEEQQEYIRLRNIKVMGEVMGKELSEEQKQRLEEFEIKLRGNESSNTGMKDTNGGEVLQENDGKKPSLIEDIQGKPVFTIKKGGNRSSNAGVEDTNGGESSQEEKKQAVENTEDLIIRNLKEKREKLKFLKEDFKKIRAEAAIITEEMEKIKKEHDECEKLISWKVAVGRNKQKLNKLDAAMLNIHGQAFSLYERSVAVKGKIEDIQREIHELEDLLN